MRRLVIDDQPRIPARADERDHWILDPATVEVGRDHERVRTPRVRAVPRGQCLQRVPREGERDVGLPEVLRRSHLDGGAAGRDGLDVERADGERDVADGTRTKVSVAEIGPAGDGSQPVRHAHAQVEVGGGCRRALRQDVRGRIGQPAAAGIPRQQREEGAEPESPAEAGDPVVVRPGQPQPPGGTDGDVRFRLERAAEVDDQRRRIGPRHPKRRAVRREGTDGEMRARA